MAIPVLLFSELPHISFTNHQVDANRAFDLINFANNLLAIKVCTKAATGCAKLRSYTDYWHHSARKVTKRSNSLNITSVGNIGIIAALKKYS